MSTSMNHLACRLATGAGALLAAWALAGCAAAPDPTMPTVAAVDLARYAGRWYEVAALPNRFQAPCVADTQARYRPMGDDIEVVNRSRALPLSGTTLATPVMPSTVPSARRQRLTTSMSSPIGR